MGRNNQVIATGGSAIGNNNQAMAMYSTAIGNDNYAIGENSSAIGLATILQLTMLRRWATRIRLRGSRQALSVSAILPAAIMLRLSVI